MNDFSPTVERHRRIDARHTRSGGHRRPLPPLSLAGRAAWLRMMDAELSNINTAAAKLRKSQPTTKGPRQAVAGHRRNLTGDLALVLYIAAVTAWCAGALLS